eukprot:CAMPEP_0204351840 /NCGR_PEP_ID=MMETSP0469-20131031/31423_1 /ASSEMBLY_ACC=CAM_ASM_000384 /TAXON_ID=2969 /ORGANISM="Oxyrrhis marina" /LENGTH=112 /DNA_ID=CAMNT_0051338463 /DNA_START=173 /DNA_END=507 /DNA_ORIENTATION=+
MTRFGRFSLLCDEGSLTEMNRRGDHTSGQAFGVGLRQRGLVGAPSACWGSTEVASKLAVVVHVVCVVFGVRRLWECCVLVVLLLMFRGQRRTQSSSLVQVVICPLSFACFPG